MTSALASGSRRRLAIWMAVGLVTVLAWATYVRDFDEPALLFWDESYHIPSAQRYLGGVFFMELHPPLGKLLIALGEAWLRPNPRTDDFVGVEATRQTPAGFSFVGFRLVPVLLGWLTAPLLFFLLLRLGGRPIWAFLLTLPYVFDNALIVHLRGALLEGPLLFFTTLALLVFFVRPDPATRPGRHALVAGLLGLAIGFAASVKLTALVLLLLLPALCLGTRAWGRALASAGGAALVAVAVWLACWQIHFALGQRVVTSLQGDGYFSASAEARRLLAEGRAGSLGALPVLLRDSLRYMGEHQRGVFRLDMCRPGNMGSPFYLWPLGVKAISYRTASRDRIAFHYLYLQANPVAWAIGLAGVLGAAGLAAGAARAAGRVPGQPGEALAVLLGLYAAYMGAMALIARTMYLHHYFVPLLLSFLLGGTVLAALTRPERPRLRPGPVAAILGLLMGLLVLAYGFYRPLTYFEPLTDAQFSRRALLPIWDLRCARCREPSFWCRDAGGAATPAR